ncbi:hypothetical protein GCM10023214_20750 [Amycolatopsis dongchuanensis]|uniref:Uncharacterized protein n=1 Tax=Amycolatopsis dongchuanensis TaxID=1070866 RepID=A0ABP9QBD9_9PSEU
MTPGVRAHPDRADLDDVIGKPQATGHPGQHAVEPGEQVERARQFQPLAPPLLTAPGPVGQPGLERVRRLGEGGQPGVPPGRPVLDGGAVQGEQGYFTYEAKDFRTLLTFGSATARQ